MSDSVRIAIIGAGHAGICMGMKLTAAGIDDFVILEQAAAMGGTWRDNTYPGASCDAPSFLYSCSFAQKTDWSRRFAWQPELLAYTAECAIDAGLMPHMRLRTGVTALRFDEARNRWALTRADGSSVEADFVVTAVGQPHRPATPSITGREAFAGAQFHSARWDHAVDLTGRRVAVIGNAASAVQFVPQIAPQVAKLTVFQRSANWLLPRKDRLYSPRLHRRMKRWPWLARLRRQFQWLFFGELQLTPLMKQVRPVQWAARQYSLLHLRRQVRDPALRAKLVTEPIGCIEAGGVRTRDGELHDAAVIIYATGFKATEFLAPVQVTGRGGRTLDDEWRKGAHAYLGVAVSGFPNLFMLYGPNTNLGHNSILVMIEAQAGYVIDALQRLGARGARRIEVRREVMDAYNRALQRDLARSVWAADKASRYKLADGTITNNWPHSTIRYRRLLRRADLDAYEIH